MYQLLHCVALRTIKYNDKHSILSAYSLETGRVSFLVPAGAGREAARRRALFMPLSIFDCVADLRPGREILTMREPKMTVPVGRLHSHPVKSAVSLFIADLLTAVLRENQGDKSTFAYIVDAIMRFDEMESGVSNFHICFLYRLGRYIGIEPDISTYRDGSLFDLLDGRFRVSAPLHNQFLGTEESKAVVMLSRMTFDNLCRFKFNRNQRNELLDQILRYYTIHYSSLGNLRSIDVLRCLFI